MSGSQQNEQKGERIFVLNKPNVGALIDTSTVPFVSVLMASNICGAFDFDILITAKTQRLL